MKTGDIDVESELSEFGFDSISLTGFANHVNEAYGLDLMPTVFFEHPTIRSFAGYMAETHRACVAAKLKLESTPKSEIVTVKEMEQEISAKEPKIVESS